MRFSSRKLSVTITLVLLLVSAPLFSQVTWDVCVAEVYSSGSCSNDLGVFTPPTITINQGDMIKFTTRMEMIGGYDGTFHDIQFTGSPANNVTLVISTNVLARWTNVTTPPFNTPGTFAMECVDGNHCFFATDFSGYVCSPYSVTVNSVGCGVTSAFTESNATICAGETISFTNTSTGADDYQWFIDTTSFSLAADTSWTFDSAGTYNVMLIASDSDSTCIDTSQTTITVNTNPTIDSMTSVNVSCNGVCDGSATVYASGGVLPLTYIWSNAFIGNPATNLCVGGPYCVTVTDANGCQDTACVTIIEPPSFEQTVTVGDASCYGNCDGFANVSFSGGTCPYSYWFDIITLGTLNCPPNSYSAPFLCAGTYIGTGVDFNGCTDTDTVVISQPPLLTISLSATNPTCNGYCDGTIQASVSGGIASYTYLWSDGQTTNPITNLCGGGTYCVTVTDQNGCVDTACIFLPEPPALATTTSQTNITCFGVCDGSATVNASGGSPPYDYLWDDPSSQTDATADSLCSGPYHVTVTDTNGCFITDSVVLVEFAPNPPNISTISSTCGLDNGAACISPVGGCTPFTYLWDDPGAQTTACATGLFSGIYNPIITDCNGCATTTPVIVNDIPGTVIDSVTTTDVTCAGDSNGTAIVFASGSSPPFTYIWTFGSDTLASGVGMITVFGLWGGNYTVSVLDAGGNSCLTSFAFPINEPAALTSTIISSSNVSCNGLCDGSATAMTGGGTPPYTYQWTNGCITTTCAGLCAGTHSVFISDVNGCTSISSVMITEPAPLVLNALITDISCAGACDGNVLLNVTGGTPFYLYTGATSGPFCPGTYCVSVMDMNGCTDSTCFTVTEPLTQLGYYSHKSDKIHDNFNPFNF